LPLPEPVAVIQLAPDAADHAHEGSAVTLTVPLPPLAGNEADDAESVTVHVGGGAGAACVTVSVCPPMVSVPVRAAVVSFAATLKATVPAPLPLAPLVTLIQLAFGVAFQAQPAPAVTVTESLPPSAAAPLDVFDNVNVHDGVPPVFGSLVWSFDVAPGRAVR
jgi:hypothetical protein